MPITQEKLMEFVADADAMLRLLDTLQMTVKQFYSSETLINTNSVIERTPDNVARKTIEDLLKEFSYVFNLIQENMPGPQTRNRIIREQEHYKVSKKRNELSARYHMRKKTGGTIGEKSLPKATSVGAIPSDAKAFYQNDLLRIEAELQKQATQAQAPAQTNTPAAPNYNADGVKRHLPTLDELNKIPDTFL